MECVIPVLSIIFTPRICMLPYVTPFVIRLNILLTVNGISKDWMNLEEDFFYLLRDHFQILLLILRKFKQTN